MALEQHRQRLLIADAVGLGKDAQAIGWNPKAKDDRLVIFTERVPTLHWLFRHLPADLGLRDQQAAILHGGMSDTEQQDIVESFVSVR